MMRQSANGMKKKLMSRPGVSATYREILIPSIISLILEKKDRLIPFEKPFAVIFSQKLYK